MKHWSITSLLSPTLYPKEDKGQQFHNYSASRFWSSQLWKGSLRPHQSQMQSFRSASLFSGLMCFCIAAAKSTFTILYYFITHLKHLTGGTQNETNSQTYLVWSGCLVEMMDFEVQDIQPCAHTRHHLCLKRNYPQPVRSTACQHSEKFI